MLVAVLRERDVYVLYVYVHFGKGSTRRLDVMLDVAGLGVRAHVQGEAGAAAIGAKWRMRRCLVGGVKSFVHRKRREERGASSHQWVINQSGARGRTHLT